MATSKKTLIAFQDINKNIIKNIFIDNNDLSLKERHEGLGIKLFPNKIKEVVNNNFNVGIDDNRFNNSIDEVKSFISDSEIDEDTDEKVESNNFKKYGYTCITFLDNNVKNKNQQMKVINFKKTLKSEEERKNRITALIENTNVSISNIKEELFNLGVELNAIGKEVVNDKKIDNSKTWKRARLEVEIEEKEKQLTEYQAKNKKLFTYSIRNQNCIKALRHNINMLEVEIKKNNIDKITENLKSEKLETRLSTQFSILKSLLNVRKDIKANELTTEKKNLKLKVKNDIITVNDKSFNANKVNDFDRQPTTNEYTKKPFFNINN